jgi:hypothetical protein
MTPFTTIESDVLVRVTGGTKGGTPQQPPDKGGGGEQPAASVFDKLSALCELLKDPQIQQLFQMFAQLSAPPQAAAPAGGAPQQDDKQAAA